MLAAAGQAWVRAAALCVGVLTALLTVSCSAVSYGHSSGSYHQHTHSFRIYKYRGRTVNVLNLPNTGQVRRITSSTIMTRSPGCIGSTSQKNKECLIDVNADSARGKHRNSGIYETYSCYTGNSRDYEVHVLSVYEPLGGRRSFMKKPTVVGDISVNINHHINTPNKPIKLVLTSYEAASWKINATGVRISEIILLSYYDVHSRVSVFGSEGTYIFRRIRQYDGYGRRRERRENLFRFIKEKLGFITSFTGTYIASHWNLTVGVPKSCSRASTVDYSNYCRSRGQGYHRDPADCSYYVICQLRRYTRVSCAPGTRWNNIVKMCDRAANVPCIPTSLATGRTRIKSADGCLNSEHCWLKYNFKYDKTWTLCQGEQYVRRSGYYTARYVGVVLCDRNRYKIFLSNSLTEEFKNVADSSGHGQDHCEFVGGREGDAQLPDDFWDSPTSMGYYRAKWGQMPQNGQIGFGPKDGSNWTGRYYVREYRCGVQIPGNWQVVITNNPSSKSTRKQNTPSSDWSGDSCCLPSSTDGASGDGESGAWQFPLQPGSRLEFSHIPNYSIARTQFSTEFRTTGSSGIMFYIADARHSDFIGLYMHKGKLSLSFNCGSGLATLITGARYNDGRWHRVEFVRDMKKGRLIVDNRERVTGLTPGVARSIRVEPPFYVGGFAHTVAKTASHNIPKDVASTFPGCMKAFKVNQRDLGTPSSEYHTYQCPHQDQGVVPSKSTAPSTSISTPPTTPAVTKPRPTTSFHFTTRPTNQTLRKGELVLLQCDTNLKSVISWYKNGQALNEDEVVDDISVLGNGVLIISSLASKHVGMYTCRAKKDDRMVETNAWVNILEAGCNLSFLKKPQNATVKENSFHFFVCDVARADDIRWEKNGEPIATAPGSRMQKLVNGYLFISKVRWFDRGLYTCAARKDADHCEIKSSAWLEVTRDVDISEICGKPVIAQPSENAPELRRGFIVGGQDAAKGSAPWHVMLFDDRIGSFCGAVLISRRWVVTAAHCFVEFQEQFDRRLTVQSLKVKLGKYDQNEKERQEKIYKTAGFIVHPEFNHALYDNDIALIKLEEEVKFTDYIIPVCLQDAAFVQRHFFNPGGFGSVTGWGALTDSRGAARPRYLNEIRLPLVERETCVQSTNYSVTDNMFCAGYAREIVGDACEGDSGGPFIMKHDGKWSLVGIVSWGEYCAKEGKYGFYTHVANYYDWIIKYTND